MSSWRKVALGDHVDLLTGFPFKSAEYLSEPEGGVRLLRGDNVSQGKLRWEAAKYLDIKQRSEYEKYELRQDDVILAMDRPWIEAGLKVAWIKRSDMPCLLVQRVARMRGGKQLSTGFLRYLVASPSFVAHIQSITTGANIPHVSGGDIKKFEFFLPPLDVQKAIVDILSSYDDMIENNVRRIEILEEMAHRLFGEWFVNFGRDEGCSESASSGNRGLPIGWRQGCLADIASINSQAITPKMAPDTIHYIDISSVSPGRVDGVATMSFADAPGRARRVVKDGDTIWSMVRPNRRSFALIQHPEPDTIASTGFAVLSPKQNATAFVHLASTTDKFVDWLVSRATGAAYPAVRAVDFEQAPMLIPPQDVLERFEGAALPLLRLAGNLRRSCDRLRTARDLLLPKLISGEISVGDAPLPGELAAE